MTFETLVFLTLAAVRSVLYLALLVSALSMMRDLSRTRGSGRRRANPALHGALMMLAGAGAGLTLHTVRLCLMQVADPGSSWYWLLLARDPDFAGEVAAALAALLGAGGVLLLIRGARGVIFGESAELPRGLRPPKCGEGDPPDSPESAPPLRGLALAGGLVLLLLIVLDVAAHL